MSSHFKIGLRTTKTAISVALCIIISSFLSNESPTLAALAAVYCLRQDTSTSISFSFHRIIGTFLGVIISMIASNIQVVVEKNTISDAIIAAGAVILTIILCQITNHKEGTISATATMLYIYFNTPNPETINYAAHRLLDVTIGAIVAVSIDYLLPSKKDKQNSK